MKEKRTGRPRAPAIDRISSGTLEGTRHIIEAVVKESGTNAAWRPVRAAAIMAMAGKQVGKDHVWMRTDEFVTWLDLYRRGRHGPRVKLLEQDTGVEPRRSRALVKGAKVTKVEALAFAHVAAGLPPPIPAGQPEVFAAWLYPRFGSAETAADVLDVKPVRLTNQLRGYAIEKGARYERLPKIAVIRALDWCLRVGPFSPWGDRLPLPAYPGQLEER